MEPKMRYEQLTHQNLQSFCDRLKAFLGNGRFTIITMGGHVLEDSYLKTPPYVEEFANGAKAVSIRTIGGFGTSFVSFYRAPNATPVVNNEQLNKTEFAFVGDQLHVRVSFLPPANRVNTFDVRLFKN